MATKAKNTTTTTTWRARLGALAGRLRPRWRRAATPRRSGDPPVVMIHGLAMPRAVMAVLAWRLRRRSGRATYLFPYSTWRLDVPAAALELSRALAERGIRECDVVAHSMGGLVLRWAMNHTTMPAVRRAVLIAAPSDGAWLASRLAARLGPVYTMLFGQSGLQMRHGAAGVGAHAGSISAAEAGVIAGGIGAPGGVRNWFGIPGDNDGTVAVEETVAPGIRDFVLIPWSHTAILFARETAHLVETFLEHGLFRPHKRRRGHGHGQE
jgi:pimeloyl-ACP methyl ester carboxylesterase